MPKTTKCMTLIWMVTLSVYMYEHVKVLSETFVDNTNRGRLGTVKKNIAASGCTIIDARFDVITVPHTHMSQ